MKRSAINHAVQAAERAFAAAGWALPPAPRWDVTDFGLGQFDTCGLVLVNLAEEAEYCEKLMFAHQRQRTPAHCHRVKKEDIIARHGTLAVQVWHGPPGGSAAPFVVRVNGTARTLAAGEVVRLTAGQRITLTPGLYHAFWPEDGHAVIGEVSTANDDTHDNFFADPQVGRYAAIEEDAPPRVRLVSEG